METELNCGKRRRRIELAGRTCSLTFLRIRVSDEDVETHLSHLADGCSRIRSQLCATTSETSIVLRANRGYARVEVAGRRVRVIDDLSLRAIEHQPHKPDVNPADFIQFPLGGRAESLRRALGRRLSQAGIRGTGSRARVSSCLLLKDHRRPADSLSLKVDGHLDTVGDLDERNAFIHPVVFTVESHCPLNLT